MADRYPAAVVIGSDLVPYQASWMPPNCTFFIDDLTSLPWSKSWEAADMIHMRDVEVRDIRPIVGEIWRCLKPGGWFEHVRVHIDYNEEHHHAWAHWGSLLKEVQPKLGKRTDRIEETMNDVGFDPVYSRNYELLETPEEFMDREDVDIEGMVLKPLNCVLGMSPDDIHFLVEGMRHEFLEPSFPIKVKV